MDIKRLAEIIGADFFTGVPDSQMRALCDYLMDKYGTDSKHHIIGVNEGNCVAIAAGYHLSTGKVPVVYMQNSGQGNSINPVVSLLHGKVYQIPCIFMIGWRGEPGISDEPQHIYQGEITLNLLENMGVDYFVIDENTTEEILYNKMIGFKAMLKSGKNVAFVIRKGALRYAEKTVYKNSHVMVREKIIRHIVRISGKSPIISTTGKASRELFEIREASGQGHQYDFLTVGSMGHASSIALGIALNKPDKKIWCIDGDGAALMHMGAMTIVGQTAPDNFVHIIINNEAHESVGGMPTAAGVVNWVKIAEGCGYRRADSVADYENLDRALKAAGEMPGPTFIEVKAAIGARSDLGRPTKSPIENKTAFMEYLSEY